MLTPAAYTARHVHAVDGVASQWWLPSRELTLDWDAAGAVTHAFGGAPSALLGDVRDQEAPELTVTWDAADAHGHPFATVLEGELRPFATDVARMDGIVDALRAAAAREHDPRLRLTAPGGTVLRSGTVGWDTRPFTFTHETAEVLQGWHDLDLQVETGAYGDRLDAGARLIVPARTLSAATVAAGGTFEVTVVFDAPPALGGDVTLTESLPDGFTVVAQATTPAVHPRQGFDGATWTWRAGGGHAYTADGLIEVAFTVRVGTGVAAGEYPLEGVAVHEGSALARAVAGPQSITVD